MINVEIETEINKPHWYWSNGFLSESVTAMGNGE